MSAKRGLGGFLGLASETPKIKDGGLFGSGTCDSTRRVLRQEVFAMDQSYEKQRGVEEPNEVHDQDRQDDDDGHDHGTDDPIAHPRRWRAQQRSIGNEATLRAGERSFAEAEAACARNFPQDRRRQGRVRFCRVRCARLRGVRRCWDWSADLATRDTTRQATRHLRHDPRWPRRLFSLNVGAAGHLRRAPWSLLSPKVGDNAERSALNPGRIRWEQRVNTHGSGFTELLKAAGEKLLIVESALLVPHGGWDPESGPLRRPQLELHE